jgi:hypothetical protein
MYVQTDELQRGPKKCIHTVLPPFSLTLLPFDKMALAFMLLTPSFERISRYTPYITFPFNFAVVSVDNLY